MEPKFTVYTIWAEGRPDGPLAGMRGCLSEGRECMMYTDKALAEQRIRDLRNQCVNKNPAATFECVKLHDMKSYDSTMPYEKIAFYDSQPDFDPAEHELQSQAYGNTGGGCMVGTASYRLPSLDKTVWVNCDNESVTITSADYIWNDDHSGSWDRFEDVLLLSARFSDTPPEKLGPWLPMVRETLAYTMEQQAAQGRSFRLPDIWLHMVEEQEQPPGPTMDTPC